MAAWTRLLGRKGFKVTVIKNTKVCSNHFKFGRPVESDPHPTLFMNKGYDREIVTGKKKVSMDRLSNTANQK